MTFTIDITETPDRRFCVHVRNEESFEGYTTKEFPVDYEFGKNFRLKDALDIVKYCISRRFAPELTLKFNTIPVDGGFQTVPDGTCA